MTNIKQSADGQQNEQNDREGHPTPSAPWRDRTGRSDHRRRSQRRWWRRCAGAAPIRRKRRWLGWCHVLIHSSRKLAQTTTAGKGGVSGKNSFYSPLEEN